MVLGLLMTSAGLASAANVHSVGDYLVDKPKAK
ncbi:hypothetical protein X741_34305 [Mesorhizobium sp. LNHC229A00]|nr:hypothetical protein X741_34305 [Mesorhizobium sp. LNHC229A00]